MSDAASTTRYRGAGSVILGLLLILALAAAGFFAYQWLNDDEDTTETISARTIAGSFDSIAEVSVEEYNYTNVGKYDGAKRQLLGRDVPGTGKHFLVIYDGTVKAGVRDFEKIDVDKDDEARHIVVASPRVEVIDSVIDMSSVETFDQSFNPFNQLRSEDSSAYFDGEEGRAAQDAIELGLLNRAEARLTELLSAQVNAITVGTDAEGYDIIIEWQ